MVNYNGILYENKIALFGSENRLLRYGDGLFESIMVAEDCILLLNYHYSRLTEGMKFLQFKSQTDFDLSFMSGQILRLCGSGNYRIRFSVFRNDGGLFLPADNSYSFLIESQKAKGPIFKLNKKGLELGIYREINTHYDNLSSFKTCNSLPYILCRKWADTLDWDDALLTDQDGMLAEASGSNLFLIMPEEIITPTLSSGCVNGVMRSFVKEVLSRYQIPVIEKEIETNDLKLAKGAFLTNASSGIRWIRKIEEFAFDAVPVRGIYDLVNKELKNLHKNNCL